MRPRRARRVTVMSTMKYARAAPRALLGVAHRHRSCASDIGHRTSH